MLVQILTITSTNWTYYEQVHPNRHSFYYNIPKMYFNESPYFNKTPHAIQKEYSIEERFAQGKTIVTNMYVRRGDVIRTQYYVLPNNVRHEISSETIKQIEQHFKEYISTTIEPQSITEQEVIRWSDVCLTNSVFVITNLAEQGIIYID
jgi:hypothetical protein